MAGDERARLVRAAARPSMAVALTLGAAKLAAWFLTGSVSLLSSLIDSALDLVASAITWFAVRHAMDPASREHRFGHGKAEALSALAQAGFVLASSVGLIANCRKPIVSVSRRSRGRTRRRGTSTACARAPRA